MSEIHGNYRGYRIPITICIILVALYVFFNALETPRNTCSNQMRKSSLSMSLTTDICRTKEGRDKVSEYYHHHLQRQEKLRVEIQRIHLERLDEKLWQEGL